MSSLYGLALDDAGFSTDGGAGVCPPMGSTGRRVGGPGQPPKGKGVHDAIENVQRRQSVVGVWQGVLSYYRYYCYFFFPPTMYRA